MIKNAIWACCVLDEDDVPRNELQVDLILLRDLMLEIKIFIEFIRLTADYEYKLANPSAGMTVNSNKISN